MPSSVRPATDGDVGTLMALRASLTPRWPESYAPTAGGFLLGSTEGVYRDRVASGCVWVAETRGVVNAYSVVLPDGVLRRTEVYTKRHDAGLAPQLLERLDAARVAYFDQLAARPGHGVAATRLAYLHLVAACESHDAVLATTVIEPVTNRAAVPLLEAVSFTPVGCIHEHYPGVGAVTSRVYLAESGTVKAAVGTERGIRFDRRATGHGAAGVSV